MALYYLTSSCIDQVPSLFVKWLQLCKSQKIYIRYILGQKDNVQIIGSLNMIDSYLWYSQYIMITIHWKDWKGFLKII